MNIGEIRREIVVPDPVPVEVPEPEQVPEAEPART